MMIDDFAAFVIPNDPFKKMDIIFFFIDYVVKIKDLEALARLAFFQQTVWGQVQKETTMVKFWE